jgi:enoyl-[acyl-carrier protein] reductase/trans-2-enoyl-CoA reductase (NAD+)
MWIDALKLAGSWRLTVAFLYWTLINRGSLEKELVVPKIILKQHLQSQLKAIDGKAFVSVNKALVTQASSAIPVIPLYISLLYKIMKEEFMKDVSTVVSRKIVY